jgi:hypothetical protein
VLRGIPGWQRSENTKVLVKQMLEQQFGIKFTSEKDSICDDSDAVAVGLSVLYKFFK